MNHMYTARTWTEIDLDALAHNLRSIRAITNPNAKIMCVVKADAYGHGFYQTAKILQENGADAFAVATYEEAMLLLEKGVCAPILILGYVDPCFFEEIIKKDICVTITDIFSARKLSEVAGKLQKKAKIHIKLDTGMSRIGFPCNERGMEEIIAVCSLPHIAPEGIFSHFACADVEGSTMSQEQFAKFDKMIKALKEQGISFSFAHICNSAGIIEFPEYHLDMVRAGIILYGCYPLEKLHKDKISLTPVMTLKARVTNVKTLPKGATISYGATYRTTKETKIATVSIGYADGLFRSLSNKAFMSVQGIKVPVVGRICMDQCMIDVSAVNTITVGDEVIVFGNGGDNSETATSFAQRADTISYEVLCAVGNRTPRIYVKNGEIIDVLTYQ